MFGGGVWWCVVLVLGGCGGGGLVCVRSISLVCVMVFLVLCGVGCVCVDWFCFVVVYDGVVGPLVVVVVCVGVSNRWVVGVWV